MKSKMGLVTLGVKDLAKSLVFYRDGLGFPTENYDPTAGVVFLRLEGTWLSLYPYEKLAEDATVPANRTGFAGITLAHNEVSKEKVDETYALAVKAGAVATKPPSDTFWGGYSGYFADPDGYPWEVAWNPGFPLNADGMIQLP